MIGEKIEITVERDSFCMQDDCLAPHTRKFEYENYQMLSEFINELAEYLPNPRSQITWNILKDAALYAVASGTKIATIIKKGNTAEISLLVPDCMISEFPSNKVYCSIAETNNM